MLRDIALNLLPVILVAPHLLAVGADRQQAAQHLHLGQRLLRGPARRALRLEQGGVADGDGGLVHEGVQQALVFRVGTEGLPAVEGEDTEEHPIEQDRQPQKAPEAVATPPVERHEAPVAEDVGHVDDASVAGHPPEHPHVERQARHRPIRFQRPVGEGNQPQRARIGADHPEAGRVRAGELARRHRDLVQDVVEVEAARDQQGVGAPRDHPGMERLAPAPEPEKGLVHPHRRDRSHQEQQRGGGARVE